MSGKADVLEALAAVFVLAVVYVLVKPGSLAPRFIAAAGEGLANIVNYAVHG
jgi:hypothetical protein